MTAPPKVRTADEPETGTPDADSQPDPSSPVAGAIPWSAIPVIVIILFSHIIVDTYSALVPTLLGVVETRFGLVATGSALLLGLGSICSGLAQPCFAWLSDRFNTRIFGAAGILIGGLAICSLGFLPAKWLLFPVYAFGMIGIGMYHPVAASTIGSLAGDRRSLVISLFFVAGMIGMTIGSLTGPWLATRGGTLANLAWLLAPGFLLAALLQWSIRGIEHNPAGSVQQKHSMLEYDLRSIVVLYCSSALKFVVNMAFIYLMLRWLQHHVSLAHPSWTETEVADFAAANNGMQLAAMYTGMAVGGLSAGWIIPKGAERMPLIVLPFLFAPAIAALAFLQPGLAGKAICFLAGCGFACMVPVTISVGQRLMPRHTSFASGLMLGGAWAIASTGPSLAQYLVTHFGLTVALASTGGILALSGLVAIGLNPATIRDS